MAAFLGTVTPFCLLFRPFHCSSGFTLGGLPVALRTHVPDIFPYGGSRFSLLPADEHIRRESRCYLCYCRPDDSRHRRFS